MRIFYLLIFSCFALFKLDAQIDTSFWFVAPRVPAPLVTTSVGMQFGTYTTAATIYVRQPANAAGVNYSFTLPANSSTVVNMTASVGLFVSTAPNVAANMGLYISSSGSISVNYIMESPTSKESISLKGKNGIGVDFYAPFTNSINTLYNGVAGNTAFDVVATENGVTTLLITPRGNLIGPRPKNNPFIVSLNQGQTFSCQEDLFTRSPYAVTTGLFDGDAFLDMAMVDNKYNNVIILKGTGTGAFTEIGMYTVSAQPVHIITDDVNNDSNRDLIVANYAGDNVSVLLGNGAGGFTSSGNFASGGNGANGVACADLNGDGNKDIVVTNNMSFSFGVLFGNGAGLFTLSNVYITPNQPVDIKISDFTNDGNRDVIVSNFGSNSLSVFVGTAAGTFPTAPTNYATSAGPYRMVVADFNGDTFEDVAVAQRGANNVRVLLSNNVGTFTTSTNFAVAGSSQPEGIVTCTVNGDASLDLVISNAGANNISILTGNGAGGFAAAVNSPVGTTPHDVAFGDFDNNGQFDFCTPNANSNNYSVLMGNGTTSPAAAVNTILGTTFYPCTELGGSIISADKKIAVSISGALATSTVSQSYYSDQITHTGKIGMHYVIHRTNTATDQAYILSPTNNTSLSITNATVTNAVMNSGDLYRVLTTNGPLTYIQTDKPVYVLSVGGHGSRVSAAQIAQAYCAGSYTAGFERESSDSLFLDVYIRPAGIGTFTLDINSVPMLIPAANFTVVPGTAGNLFGARIYFSTATIPQGAYCILRNNVDLFGFSVQNGSNANGSHFSHHSNFNAETFVKANPVATATICTNTSLTLNGVIGGGPNTGVWSSTGSGSFSGGPNLITGNAYVPSLQDTLLKPTPLPLGWTGGSVNITLMTTGICPNISDYVGVRILQGPIVDAGPNQVKCTNNATISLNGTVFGASSQGTWAVVPPGTGTFNNPSVLQTTYTPSSNDTTLSNLQFQLTSINNGICNAGTDIITVVLQKAPLVDAAPAANTVACANNSTVYLNGYISNSIPTGIWSTSGSGIFIPNNISLTGYYVPSLTDVANSPIKLKLTTPPSALCKTVADSVMVFFTQPAVISAGADLNSCKNNPMVGLNAVITGTSSSTVVWNGSGNFTPTNTVLSPTYIATPTEIAAGFAIITVSTTNNGICASVNDQVRIDFRDKPTAAFLASTVCLNMPTQFNDQSINPSGIGFLSGWQWDFGNGQNSTQTSPVITYTAPGTYTVQLVVNNSFNCFDSLTKSYQVFPLPDIKFGYSRLCTGSAQNICFTDSSTILPPSNIPVTSHYWDFGGVGFSVTKDTCFIFPTDGKYTITHQATSNDGCVNAVTQTINITPKPDARFTFINSGVIGLATNIQFNDSSKYAVTWAWDFGNGTSSNQQNPTTTYNTNGNYTVTQIITDQFGCPDSYSLVIGISNVVEDPTRLIPNIISPNGDGKNDYWRLDFINVFYQKAEIEIFNRWGESIFKSTGYSNAWDGTYRGEALPVGAYYYTIDLKDPDRPGVIKGNITLLK